MDFGLRDKVAIVTGGAAGIGAAIVEQLAREGCDVAIVDRAGGERGAALVMRVEAAGRRASVHEADVADFALAERTVAAIAAAHGRVDLLVCCAGVTDDGLSWKLTEAQWDRVLAVNLKGCFNWCRAVAPLLRDQRAGRIVNIASINGLRGKFGQANYTAAKAGMIGLTKTAARELGPKGITVNAVAPGMVMTEMARALPAEVLERALQESVMRELATPDDIAAAVVFLLSDMARMITGEVIRVDAGQYV